MMRGTSTGTMIRILFVFWATFALYPAQQLEFGDIISVGRSHINGKPLYTHWALYVGKGPVEGLKGKKDDQDIFHITGVLNIKLSDCVFGKMGSNKYSKNNYLDKDKNGNGNEVKSKEEMIKKINELHHNCGRWNPLSHNCEHIATSIRYGFQHSEQKNTKAEKLMKRIQKKKDEKENKKKKEKEIKAGKRSLMDLLDHDSSLAAAGA